MDTTTIEIRKDQKEELDSMGFGSYKAALQELIENYNESEGLDENRVREIAKEVSTEVVEERVRFEALE